MRKKKTGFTYAPDTPDEVRKLFTKITGVEFNFYDLPATRHYIEWMEQVIIGLSSRVEEQEMRDVVKDRKTDIDKILQFGGKIEFDDSNKVS